MKKILFVGGSLNQSTIAHAVARELEGEYECYFSPYYVDGFYSILQKLGLLEFTVVGGNQLRRTKKYFADNNLPVDYGAKQRDYDLFVFVQDILLPGNTKGKPLLLIQEGMTDREGFAYRLVKWFKFPLYVSGTAATGLSDRYQTFCVASEGYKELFVRKGARREKIVVTGLPNFDNAVQYYENDFPHKDYVMVATSDSRETFKRLSKKKFLEWTRKVAKGRQMIFKLHPNENFERSTQEIKAIIPDAMVMTDGNTEQMIANSEALITEYSSCIYVGLALEKECYSDYFDIDFLQRLLPEQNGGASGANIAAECRKILEAN